LTRRTLSFIKALILQELQLNRPRSGIGKCGARERQLSRFTST